MALGDSGRGSDWVVAVQYLVQVRPKPCQGLLMLTRVFKRNIQDSIQASPRTQPRNAVIPSDVCIFVMCTSVVVLRVYRFVGPKSTCSTTTSVEFKVFTQPKMQKTLFSTVFGHNWCCAAFLGSRRRSTVGIQLNMISKDEIKTTDVYLSPCRHRSLPFTGPTATQQLDCK